MIKKQASGKWLCDIQPGGRTAKRIKRVFRTQTEAKQFEVWFKSNTSKDHDWQPDKKDRRHLSEFLDIWWDAHGYSLAAGEDTYRRLKGVCRYLENPVIENFNAEVFARYRTERSNAGVSLNTLNREHAYMRSVFNELIRIGVWKKENPLRRLRQFKIQERELSYLDRKQIDVLLQSLSQSINPHVLLISKVCLVTGARWGEIEGLKIYQIQNGKIQFSQTKSKKTRGVPIDSEIERELVAHHEKFKDYLSERLFESSYAAFISALERAGIQTPKGQATHILRHSFASYFVMGGGSIIALQRILGHSDLKMTMRYAHLAPEHLEQAKFLNPLAVKAEG